MGLQALRCHALALVDAGLHCHDLAAHDDIRIDLAEGHAQEVQNAYARSGHPGLHPPAKKAGENNQYE